MPIKVFVGLKAKMYAFITEDNQESKKAKSINKTDINKIWILQKCFVQ